MPYAYILEIKAGTEARSTQVLESFSLEVICPYFEKPRRSRGQRRKTEVHRTPALPGYLVIRGSGVPWQRVFDTPTIFGALGFGGIPSMISDEIVNHVRSMTIPVAERTRFKPGDSVTVTDGAWIGTPAKIVSLEDERAKILLQCFGGNQKASISVDKIEAA